MSMKFIMLMNVDMSNLDKTSGSGKSAISTYLEYSGLAV